MRSRYDFHFVSSIISRANDRLQATGNVNVRIVRTVACDEQAAVTDGEGECPDLMEADSSSAMQHIGINRSSIKASECSGMIY